MAAWFIDDHEVEVSGKSEQFCADRQNFQKLESMHRKFKGQSY